MKSIVWFEPERVTPGTFLYTNNPAWLLGREGDQKLLNLGHAEARAWLINHVDRLLTEQGIDLYRQDYNIDPLNFWRGADAEERQGITENHYVTGYLAYWDELLQRHPGMLIDSCASGGHRNDLETLRRSLPFLRSDFIQDAVGNQCHTYGLSFWLPYHGTGTSSTGAYDLRSALACPHFIACWDMRDRNLDYDFLRKTIGDWRQIRAELPWRFLSAHALHHGERRVARLAVRSARKPARAWCRPFAARTASTNPPASNSAASTPRRVTP